MGQEKPNELTTKLLAVFQKLKPLIAEQSKLKIEVERLDDEAKTILQAQRKLTELINKQAEIKSNARFDIMNKSGSTNSTANKLAEEIKYLRLTGYQINIVFTDEKYKRCEEINQSINDLNEKLKQIESEIEQVKNEFKAHIEEI